MAQTKKQQAKSQNKLTREQKAARIKVAEERARKAAEQRERAERRKKVFTVVVCVILVLALGIPTVALSGAFSF